MVTVCELTAKVEMVSTRSIHAFGKIRRNSQMGDRVELEKRVEVRW
jgi:hypothetical protein